MGCPEYRRRMVFARGTRIADFVTIDNKGDMAGGSGVF
jgi:hypothetical protein